MSMTHHTFGIILTILNVIIGGFAFYISFLWWKMDEKSQSVFCLLLGYINIMLIIIRYAP